MLKRHKKIVNEYFRDVTIWFYGMLSLIAIIVIAFIMIIITAGPGDKADMAKPLVTVAIFLYALYSGRGILKFKHRCMKDLKRGEIDTKSITITQFGGDGKHNLGILGSKKPMGKIKYAFRDEKGYLYYLVQGKKKALPDGAIVGRTIAVTYLKNTNLILEIGFDLRDDIDASLDNFREVFPQYFERIYD